MVLGKMVEQKVAAKKPRQLLKRVSAGVAIFLGVVVAFLAFVHFMPGWDLYFVQSGSMRPVFNPGDIVITHPFGNLKAGEIITYEQNKAMVTHRVIEINNGLIYTKGDANEDPDPHPVTIEQVKGVYLFRIPYLGYINGLVSSRKGWFVVIIVPTMVLVGFIVKDIVKESLKKETQKAAEETKGDGAVSVNKE